MTRRRKCLEIIEKFQDPQFKEPAFQKGIDALDELEYEQYTGIWQSPERLLIPGDFSLLFNLLHRQLIDGNYENTLEVCTTIATSEYASRESIYEKITDIFTHLLTLLLKEEKKRKIDHHVVLTWLDAGDHYFFKENNEDYLDRKTYAVLKTVYFVKTWKSKFECYSCGCAQRQIIELFRGNNCSRLFEALHSIVKGRVKLKALFKRIFETISSDIQNVDYFRYYTEIIQELRQCDAIDISDEKTPSSLIQLTGLMWELKSEDVLTACFHFHQSLVSICEAMGEQKSAVERVIKIKLVPKIFESLSSSGEIKLDGFCRANVQKFVDLILKESYSAQKSLVFAPLQLLNFLYDKYDIWAKTKQFVNSRIDSINMNTQQGPVVVLYLLSLICRNDNSLIGHLVEVLEKQYTKKICNKNKILLILEIAEKLGTKKPAMAAYFKENRVKAKLILSTELDTSEHVELVFEYLSDLNPHEYNQYLNQKTSSLKEKLWNDLFRKIKHTSVCITSDDVWQCAVERKNSERDAVEFIGNQLKRMAQKNDRVALGIRVGQVFRQIRTVSPSTKLPPRELLLAFPEILLSFSDYQYSSLPLNTTSSLIPVAILSYCLFLEGNEQRVMNLFRFCLSKVKINGSDSGQTSDSIELMEIICESIKSGSSADLHFIRPNGGIETFLKIIGESDDTLRTNFRNVEVFARAKERSIEMCSVLFGCLATQLQALGDRGGKTPFCQLALVTDRFITASLPSSTEHSTVWRISERMIRGFAEMTQKWNTLFAVPRVMNILTASQTHEDHLRRLMGIVKNNQILLGQLRKKNEFMKLETALER